MIRRRFLALTLALGGLGWAQRSSIAAEVAEQAVPGWLLVRQLKEITGDLAACWDDGHPAQLQRRLLGLYTVVAEMADAVPLTYTRDLGHLAALNAAVLGLMTRIVGEDDRSLTYLLAADAWAQEVADAGLRALIAVWRSDVDSAVQAGRPGPSSHFVRDQLDLAESCAGTTAPPAVRALMLLRQAEEHAAAGEVSEAFRYLDRADTAWSTAGSDDYERGLYGISWSDTVMEAFRANVAILAGQPAHALPILERIIPTARSNSNRVAATTDLAAACARLGEIEHAAELLNEALAAAQGAGLEERARRVVGVRWRDLAGHDQVPAVRRLDDAVGGWRNRQTQRS